MMKKTFALLWLFAAGFLSAAPEKPNIVFLLVDDLGWGDFGCYGAEFYETPNIDKLAKLDLRPEQHKDGISIVNLLKDPKATLPRESIYWHYPHYHRTKPYGAIRHGDWKLIEFFENGNMELFDLKSDPNETKDLSKENPEKAAELFKQLVAWRKSVDAQMPTPNPNYDPNASKKRGKRKPRTK